MSQHLPIPLILSDVTVTLKMFLQSICGRIFGFADCLQFTLSLELPSKYLTFLSGHLNGNGLCWKTFCRGAEDKTQAFTYA